MMARTSLFIGMRVRSVALAVPSCSDRVNGSVTLHGLMAFRLLPREEKFYTDFQALADELKRGARLLEEMLAPERPIWDKADEIKEVEHKCDFLTHEIIQRLNRTFVTPLDREDIFALARSLDDVMDAIDASATVVRLYQIDRVRQDARDLARIIMASVEQVVNAMKALELR